MAHRVFVEAGRVPLQGPGGAGMVFLEEILMAPRRASVPLPFPTVHAGSWLVGRRAMPRPGETGEQRNGSPCNLIGKGPKQHGAQRLSVM